MFANRRFHSSNALIQNPLLVKRQLDGYLTVIGASYAVDDGSISSRAQILVVFLLVHTTTRSRIYTAI